MTYSPKSFNAAFMHEDSPHRNDPVTNRMSVSKTTGERLLSTGATWDVIQNHDFYRRGMIDLGEVVDRLRDKAVCDGVGPCFPEDEVLKAIEDSVGVPGDELI